MASRLLYVMDPMCSWCWGFAPVVEALAEQAAAAGVPLQIVVGGLRRDQVAIDAAARVRYLGYWQAVNASTGQLFDFERGLPEGLVYDTEPACRALVTARQLDAASAWTLLKLIQQAFYTEGADVTQASVLVQLAEQAGIPRIEFAEAFDSQAMQEATAADFTWVQDLGIAGFPTLLAERDGQLALLTNGYQPLEVLAPLLGRWLERAAHA
ncbi:DsbA family protein [Pseudomonas oleovorans]|uniref:DsbA family protein n=1 Tax=Ectopseudomonas oleovorans TaxID=301 RepID=A0A2S7FKH9_ECTOL|nr:DsbA family protein [Pseudomonas oleovorans]MCR1828111.1 DsbA family protein [Pseudomonas oleovorans]MDH0569015.1 DsbA family protein [Pseudomonas oleovorans]PPV35612.1 disulfide bond formation protein DsbA [Pseudomonas oleovorans]